jgi:ribonuclease HII
MILAGVLLDNKKQEQTIKSWGAKDSKLLTPQKRHLLKNKIISNYQHKITTTSPKKIDNHKNLNTLEAEKTASIINHFAKTTDDKIQVIVDCPSTNIKAWTETVRNLLDNPNHILLSCKHKADRDHPVVSAASILAKESREEEIKKLKQLLKIDFGSGYPADPKTKNFVTKNHSNPTYANIIRFSWATIKKLQRTSSQRKLFKKI